MLSPCKVCGARPREVQPGGKVNSYCIECDRARARRYHRENRERINARRRTLEYRRARSMGYHLRKGKSCPTTT